ncbi:Serine/threonine-protein phosphatase 7 long form-like protein [Senna tora]|uniref:Serine/threonine-protein phosphatase 7 long form-like protein n=1 Tax=Senna tora TaxID=362788 RepID=A0A835CCF1_9FABA|nr:Serine/threonine-protein phosphatase 7 long form-like protein [Senna tora]
MQSLTFTLGATLFWLSSLLAVAVAPSRSAPPQVRGGVARTRDATGASTANQDNNTDSSRLLPLRLAFGDGLAYAVEVKDPHFPYGCRHRGGNDHSRGRCHPAGPSHLREGGCREHEPQAARALLGTVREDSSEARPCWSKTENFIVGEPFPPG